MDTFKGNSEVTLSISPEIDRRKIFYFWKGRVAFYCILKALGISHGDEVIVPGFTCVVVPNAIMYLGATPVYADIDPLTYNIAAQTIEPHMTSRTKAIVVQNTFGLSADLDPIIDFAKSKNLCVIEDCAHGLGGKYKGRSAGSIADASFFSTQWSKPVTTGLGGFLVVNHPDLAAKVDELYNKIPFPSFLSQLILETQCYVRPFADSPILYYSLVGAYRFLTQKAGLSIGSSSGRELSTIKMPPSYLLRMGKLQKRRLFSLLKIAEKIIEHRKIAAHKFDTHLEKMGIQTPFRPSYAEHSMLRYSIRVPNKRHIIEKAIRNHIPIGDWFVSPLHPIEKNLKLWHYQSGQCPEAEKACREVVNLLPDHLATTENLKLLFQ